jgi:hypothetical protein
MSNISVIFCLVFLFCAQGTQAQEDLKILFEFSPDAVVQDEPFAINLLVNHPDPNEIYVNPPDFENAFRMERMLTDVRMMLGAPRSSEQWTAFEFLLIAGEPGAKELGPFEVTVQGKTKATNPIIVNVQEAKRKNLNIRFVWDIQNGLTQIQNDVIQGGVYEAVLRVINRETGKLYPEFPVQIEAPENAIVEKIPPSKKDYDDGIVLRLRIVPLNEQPVMIKPQSVTYEKSHIEIPPLTINVRPAIKPEKIETIETPSAEPETNAELETRVRVKPVSLSLPSGDNTFFRGEAAARIAEAGELWAEKDYAGAVALLRHGEMALFGAGFVRNVRAACEDALGLPPGPNETWLPRKPLLIVSSLFTAAFIILFCVRKKTRVPLSLLLTSLFLSVSAGLALSFSYSYGKDKAVLKNCAAYPIPEDGGKAAVFFMEGEPAHIRSQSDSWVYVESLRPDILEKSGWVKKENAVMIAR